MSRPTRAVINLAAIRQNLACAQACAPRAKVWAVVKANAYGHGLAQIGAALGAADGLALLEFDAALALRERQPQRPILMLEGSFSAETTALAYAHDLEIAVHDDAQLHWIEQLDGPRRLSVWVKMNSGMNRLGFARSHVRAAYERLTGAQAVARIGLMTHFANADTEDGWRDPLSRFDLATQGLPGKRSTANSAAVLTAPDSHRDWIRPGIMLYGATPIANASAGSFGLRPAMTLESSVIGVQSLLPGDRVGYGGSFVARRPMRIGIVACGYADGYPRAAGTGTPVWAGGRRTRVLGRVSMDMLAIELDEQRELGVGSRVELWGEHVSVDDVAQAADTIGYELLCRLAPRVPVTWIDQE